MIRGNEGFMNSGDVVTEGFVKAIFVGGDMRGLEGGFQCVAKGWGRGCKGWLRGGGVWGGGGMSSINCRDCGDGGWGGGCKGGGCVSGCGSSMETGATSAVEGPSVVASTNEEFDAGELLFRHPYSQRPIKAPNIFAASSEASATAMEWAMSEMIRKPQIMKREQDEVRSLFDGQGNVDESRLHELKYLDAIIKEILRLHPSAPLLVPRECGEQCEINGYQIPAKARLFVNARAIGRDPKYWSEAEKFNPSRFLDSRIDFQGDDFEYIPFGAGRRICPGIAFSQPVIQLALAQLLFHFDWKLPGEMKQEELDMTAKFGITMRRKNDLLLIPIPYSRSCLIMDNSTP
nr:tabersonine 16-hydroxylase 2-like [Coffea arabica]